MEKSSKCVTDKIIIGRIGRPQGIKGGLRLYPLTDFPDRFDNLTEAYIDDRLVTINSIQQHSDFLVLNIKGLTEREAAAALTGKFLQIERENAAPLAEGEYYTFDIIGMAVYNEDNLLLGKINNILKTGSNDVYVIKSEQTEKEILLPALKKTVTKIDVENKRMDVIWPDVK